MDRPISSGNGSKGFLCVRYCRRESWRKAGRFKSPYPSAEPLNTCTAAGLSCVISNRKIFW